jgi:uncharacterized protein (TIGR03086 family)
METGHDVACLPVHAAPMTTTNAAPTTHTTTDVRELLARAVTVGTETIAAVRADQLELPTPCDELDVRGILGHLVGVLDRAAAMGRGEDPMSSPGTIDVADEDDGWVAAWAAAVADVEAAWQDDEALDRIVVLPWLTAPGRTALLGYVNETVVHTWDLAQAIGSMPAWDDEVVAAAYGAIAGSLPPEGRLEMFEQIREHMDVEGLPDGFRGAPFGEAVTVPADAPPIDKLVAYTGRRPASAI